MITKSLLQQKDLFYQTFTPWSHLYLQVRISYLLSEVLIRPEHKGILI